jgi:alpha-1,6-mannosyltransferase
LRDRSTDPPGKRSFDELDPLKLLDITEFFSPYGGGVRTYLKSKAQWLSDRTDIEHAIVLPSDRNSTELWHASRVCYVEGAPVPASPGYHFLTASGAIQAIFERERPDVVEVGSPFLAPWISRRASRSAKPVFVGYYHCDVPSVYVSFGLRRFPTAIGRLAEAILRRYLAITYGKMHHMVAATASAESALRSLGLSAISNIPLGVDTSLFNPSRQDPKWKSELGIDDKEPVALYVGRFAAEKGLDVVLRALPQLVAESKLKLVLIGEGHLRDRLSSLSDELEGSLKVLRYESDRRELARAYASADIYIAPFPYETFGLSAVEAMACGTPVVGADSGGLIDLLRDSDCGRLFTPGDVDDLTRQVLGMLEQGPSELGKRARESVEGRYSWDQTFGTMMKLYTDLARERRIMKHIGAR